MERKTWSAHSDMEMTVKPVQNQKKKRSQSEKIGRLKYNQQLLKQTLSEIEEVKLMLRTIFAGLKGSFNFEQSLIQRVACIDEVDQEIVQLLYEAGSPGLLPKDIQAKLERFKVTRHQISRRILRMNKRLEKEFGERIAEKRGWHWALTAFIMETWGDSQKADEPSYNLP
jgi:septal ring factor EnvC (AmiA/AmiB activator)